MNMNLHIASLLVKQYPDMPETVTEAYRVISGGLLKGSVILGWTQNFQFRKR